MSATRKFGIRRVMTPNQIVAHNVARARELRGWTQEQAAEALAPYLGAKLSGPSFSNLERSAVKVERIRQFSADDLLALSRGFDLPIGFFFTPLPPAMDAGLFAPDAGSKGLDPIVLLDAILGTPENLEYWAGELLAYSASHAPMPRSKREKPSVSPADLADRLDPLVELRAQAMLRDVLGDLDGGADLLERLAGVIRAMDETARAAATDRPARGDTADEAALGGARSKPTKRGGR
jgi:transcriptional regulator with XRE-family HTH domain